MMGFPRVLSIKEDFYNLKPSYPKQVKGVLKSLMNDRFIWIEDKEVAANQPHVNNDKVKVVQTTQDGKDVFMQMKLVEDANAEFFRLGWTVPEANEFLDKAKEGK